MWPIDTARNRPWTTNVLELKVPFQCFLKILNLKLRVYALPQNNISYIIMLEFCKIQEKLIMYQLML